MTKTLTKHLVIVESPAKAKTIKKYLGKGYEVLASYGHVRDLISKTGAVDPAKKFKMKYAVDEKKAKHVEAIAKALKKADTLLLATDPDREGEAISWHLQQILKERKALEGKKVQRVVFYEITKNAVNEAVANPRKISKDLVDAQQARRALDHLVGFTLSPLLWRLVRPGLSAGRVQSPALRLICERENEIDAFRAREYWTIEADCGAKGQAFRAKLIQYQGEKVEQFTFEEAKTAQAVEATLRKASQGKLAVAKVDKRQRKRNPSPPFTTSTLQQEASRKLGFGAQRTMRTAQKLYEGMDLGEGPVGLISYMRTDSVSLAKEAVEEIRATVAERFGADSLPAEPIAYKTKSKNAQEAHEAIRPTAASRTPDQVKQFLEPDQFRLYELIWKRTVACQMVPAIYDTVALDLACGPGNTFRANGSVLVKAGFYAVYHEDADEAPSEDDEDHPLPPLEEGDAVALDKVHADQHFTEPPPRYSEASLVKALEEFGIGRPSTYASIIGTLQRRQYVEMDGRRFIPTDVGRIVNRMLTEHFTKYVDFNFTAYLEDELDEISRGERDWVPVLEEFWKPFKKLCETKGKKLTRADVTQSRELGPDPESARPISVRMGRFGAFVQMGTREDEVKPRFAGLRPGQRMDSVTLEDALHLFKLPRALGETAAGEPVTVAIGRFGPYVKYGAKYASIKEDDPYTVTRERALEIVAAKEELERNRLINKFEAEGIQVLNGRYGPYVTDGKKNAKVPKDRDPKSLTLAECQAMIEAAPFRPKGGFKRRAKEPA
jgi:DNA topoisomerase-1